MSFARVNGLELYYEIDGTGKPLVYLLPAHGHAGLKAFPAIPGRRRSRSIIAASGARRMFPMSRCRWIDGRTTPSRS